MEDQAAIIQSYIKEMADFIISSHSIWKIRPKEGVEVNEDEKYDTYLGISEGLEIIITNELYDVIFPPKSGEKTAETTEDNELKKRISTHWFVSAKHLDIKIEK